MTYKDSIIIFFIAGLFVCARSQVRISNCTKVDSCSCIYDDGTIVDLHPLERKDGLPHFPNVSDTSHDIFFWNPCSPFTLPANNSECVNVSVCMTRQGIPFTLYYDLGNQDSANFNVDQTGALKLIYTADKGEYKRITEITLQCKSSSVIDYLQAAGEQDVGNDTIKYELTLASIHSCPTATKVTPAKDVSGMSGGTVFIIVLFSLIGAYVVFGVMFQAFVKKESGKRLFPNHEFWSNLPSLLKAGCQKVTSPLSSSEKTGKYDSI